MIGVIPGRCFQVVVDDGRKIVVPWIHRRRMDYTNEITECLLTVLGGCKYTFQMIKKKWSVIDPNVSVVLEKYQTNIKARINMNEILVPARPPHFLTNVIQVLCLFLPASLRTFLVIFSRILQIHYDTTSDWLN